MYGRNRISRGLSGQGCSMGLELRLLTGKHPTLLGELLGLLNGVGAQFHGPLLIRLRLLEFLVQAD